MFQTQLYEGALVRFAAFDPDKDAAIESRWTHDAEYAHGLGAHVVAPLSPFHVRKQHADAVKEHEHHQLFEFMIHAQADDRLIGTAKFSWIQWNVAQGHFNLAIGDAADRGAGFGTDALKLIQQFAFDELNLFRLVGVVDGANDRAVKWLQRVGFTIEVRRRKAVLRNGRRYDALKLAQNREDYHAKQQIA